MVLEPFFTIVTASLNNEPTIRETLVSVADQSFRNLEHIVMDGGSSDQTVDILKEFERNNGVKWISEPDSGIPNALNKGLGLAKGKYILVLQADDRLMDREALERVHRLLEKEEHDIYSFPVIREEGLHGRFAYKPLKILWWHHFKTIFPHQGTFVSRRVFERIGGFREELTIAFDYDFFYRALQARCTVKFGKEPAAVMGGTGISSNSSLLGLRLEEECLVQCLNETNRAWKTAQNCFRAIYLPYKTRFAPLWKAHSRKCSMICAH